MVYKKIKMKEFLLKLQVVKNRLKLTVSFLIFWLASAIFAVINNSYPIVSKQEVFVIYSITSILLLLSIGILIWADLTNDKLKRDV